MDTLGDLTVPGAFLDALTHNLHQLYDPAALQHSPLIAWLDLETSADPALALRRTLTDTIERLRPERAVPPHAHAWRYFHILQRRFIEQYSQQEVADDLGLSVRQLRRQEKTAIALLAATLWRRYSLVPLTSSPAMPPPLDHELAWSQQAFAHETVAATEVVESVLRMAAPLLANHAVTAQLEAPARLPMLAVARVPVEQALLALLTAAVQEAEGGRVRIQLEAGRERLILRYAIDQAGSAPPPESAVFRMGQKLVEMLGGAVSATLGTEAWVIEAALPIAPVVQVLAIEDNPDTLRLWTRYVEGTRFHLTGIQDATQAIAAALESSPQIIVLDVMLPGIDGWELLGRLRAHPRLQHVPVVVCTILPQAELAQALGAAGFLRKPVGRREFLTMLEAQLHRLEGDGGEQSADARQQPPRR